jgi:hypothetical protein
VGKKSQKSAGMKLDKMTIAITSLKPSDIYSVYICRHCSAVLILVCSRYGDYVESDDMVLLHDA